MRARAGCAWLRCMKLSNRELEESDLEGLTKEVLHTSDRTAAIVLTAWVERELEQWIVTVLPRNDPKTIKKLQGRDGALSSFYGKIHLGFALGVYDEVTRDNLDIIRGVRNEFAHAAQPISFETDEISSEVAKLKSVPRGDSSCPEVAALSEPRRRFTSACAALVVRSRLEPVREALELFRDIHDVIYPATEEFKTLPTPEIEDRFKRAITALQRLVGGKSQVTPNP